MTVTATKKPKRKKGLQPCQCLKLVQEKAKEHGFQFVQSLAFNFDTKQASIAGPFLLVEKSSSAKARQPLPKVECAYCPFCGKKKPS